MGFNVGTLSPPAARSHPGLCSSPPPRRPPTALTSSRTRASGRPALRLPHPRCKLSTVGFEPLHIEPHIYARGLSLSLQHRWPRTVHVPRQERGREGSCWVWPLLPASSASADRASLLWDPLAWSSCSRFILTARVGVAGVVFTPKPFSVLVHPSEHILLCYALYTSLRAALLYVPPAARSGQFRSTATYRRLHYLLVHYSPTSHGVFSLSRLSSSSSSEYSSGAAAAPSSASPCPPAASAASPSAPSASLSSSMMARWSLP